MVTVLVFLRYLIVDQIQSVCFFRELRHLTQVVVIPALLAKLEENIYNYHQHQQPEPEVTLSNHPTLSSLHQCSREPAHSGKKSKAIHSVHHMPLMIMYPLDSPKYLVCLLTSVMKQSLY